MSETDRPLPDWVTVIRAARELNTTTALIEANIRAGRIHAEHRPDPRGRQRLMIPAGEILRLRSRETGS